MSDLDEPSPAKRAAEEEEEEVQLPPGRDTLTRLDRTGIGRKIDDGAPVTVSQALLSKFVTSAPLMPRGLCERCAWAS
jgi:hypothetical protein